MASVVVGSLNTDLVVEVTRLPRPGETVAGGDLRRLPGGKGANQAVAAARLGGRVEMVGAVGDDDLGDRSLAALAAEGVGTQAVVVRAGRPSGVALIVVEAGGENTISLAPGANGTLCPADVDTAHELIAAADVLLLQLEVPVAAALAAAERMREAGRLVVLNAAPLAQPVPDDVQRLLDQCDVVVVNEQEAAALQATGRDLPERLVVTLGSRGARWSDLGAQGSCPAFLVDSIDAVGAGDTFVAALAVALAAGHDLPEAVRRSCAAGALATLVPGAQAGMPTAAQVDALLSADG